MLSASKDVTILPVEQNAKMALKQAGCRYIPEIMEMVLWDDAATLQQDENIVNSYLGS